MPAVSLVRSTQPNIPALDALPRLPPLSEARDCAISNEPFQHYRVDMPNEYIVPMANVLLLWPRDIVDPVEWPHLDDDEKRLQSIHAGRAKSALLEWLAIHAPERPLLLTQDQAIALVTVLCWLPPPSTWPGAISTPSKDPGCAWDHDPETECALSGFLALLYALQLEGVHPE